MPRGGARPNSGRKKGVLTVKTRKEAARLALNGETPLEFLINVMRCEEASGEMRFEAAKAAAPYMHPRLNATTLDAKVQGSMTLINEFPD
jgi:hypothetical protein